MLYHVVRLEPTILRGGCNPVFLAVTNSGEIVLYFKRLVSVVPDALLSPTVVDLDIVVTPLQNGIFFEDNECRAGFNIKDIARLIVLSGFMQLPGSIWWIEQEMVYGVSVSTLFKKLQDLFEWDALLKRVWDVDRSAASASAIALYILGLLSEHEVRERMLQEYYPILTFWRTLLGRA